MTYFIEWQIKTGIIIGLMVLVYVIFLSRDSLFKRNRIWLLSALLVPWIMPLFAMPVWLKNLLHPPKEAVEITAVILEGVEQTTAVVPVSEPIDWAMLALGFYLLLTLFFLVRMLWGYSIIYSLRRKSSQTSYEGLKVNWLWDKDINPFSFYRSIFVPKALENKPECNHILEHEKAHCKQWHSVDISLAEIVLILQWWNPFAWWLRQLIAQNHEFCVDKAVMQVTSEPKHYQYSLMNFLPGSKGLKLVNNFSQSLIKKRIIMMNNSKNNSFLIHLKSVGIAAVMLVALLAFTNPEKTEAIKLVKEDVKEIKTTEDLRKFFARNIKYPIEARQNSVEGNVVANVAVNKKGKVGQPQIGAAKEGDVVRIDEVLVVAYESSGGSSELSMESNQLLDAEVEKVLAKLPKVTNVDLLGKTLEFNVKFELQKKKTPSMVGRDVTVTNSNGQEFTLLLTESGFTLDGADRDRPAFTLNNKEVSWSVIEKLSADEVKAIGFGPIGNDLKGRIADSSNGSFSVITNEFYETVIKNSSAKFTGKPLYVVNEKIYDGVMDDLKPDNIHSMNVIKGQSAIDKYGEAAKDGAIEIITKEYAIEKGLTDVMPLKGDVLKTRSVSVEGVGSGTVVINNVDGEKEPLFFVDGKLQKEVDINPDDIESVNVVKGQEAIDKYGEDAENGVVEISTKENIGNQKSPSTNQVEINSLTISTDNERDPLYIVDGTKHSGSQLNAEDIESVNVIKGSEAIDKYGDDAKNGVVEITTKANAEEASSFDDFTIRATENFQMNSLKFTADDESAPVFIVDGELKEGNEVEAEDIESIHVVKGQAALDKYGVDNENGVIEINTKEGSVTNEDMKLSGESVTLHSPAVGVRIKGNTNGKQPLYIIDGEEIDGERFKDIDSDDIKSLTVLKDKTATDLYGEKAKDGVIIIEMKK
ncbi:M56 family metallopeptidase [Carboxylicivirga sp. N1Y90]|uniref:M56 family metallopeptidase n=1 Tax=Carboxylicivirga fragile TaxID=3417571 RepID=UPI003D334C18|nr:TonB-dependent receptor plug domain-containing protein [Marinilabiliaceae bacterium N1Y90]